jgi:hypothetical protein
MKRKTRFELATFWGRVKVGLSAYVLAAWGRSSSTSVIDSINTHEIVAPAIGAMIAASGSSVGSDPVSITGPKMAINVTATQMMQTTM